MSTISRRYSALKYAKYNLYDPKRFDNELPQHWLLSKPPVNVDGNKFVEINLNSDDTLLLLRQSRLFNVRQEALQEAKAMQLKLLEDMEKNDEIQKVPQKWEGYLNDLKRGSQSQAEKEYLQLSRWKVRTEERKPERDVLPYDYLWVAHAMKSKVCTIESHAKQYFPLHSVIQGIKILADKLLGIKEPPKDEDWYVSLCPWFTYEEVVKGYPRTLTPVQAWQMFRHAGHKLALTLKEENPNSLITSADLYGQLFERFASNPTFMGTYTNHWSRVELLPSASQQPLPPKYASLLAKSYRNMPAFRVQQAWWYAQPDKLKDEVLEEGIYFYPVPSVRHTLKCGVPALKGIMAELAASMLWHHLADDGDIDINDELFEQLSMAVEEVEESEDAMEKIMMELRGAESPLLAAPDLTRMSPVFPNQFYDETYRPIMRYEIDHAASEGLELPPWYTRRRRELAMGPNAAAVPDLGVSATGELFDFDEELAAEEELRSAEERKAAEEQARLAAEAEAAANVELDAMENPDLTLGERLRMAQLENAITTKNDKAMQNVLLDQASSERDN
eukprot:TRINITY_DN20597_c0_g1_i1.p1 TRINITY_DN20597_c0_g1~~TRINITY_DN20597_c0_g1_i1.p1  ORF type:complete len:591 (+),score=173.39 TRINITY_DN20597_c0_g1_i1:92-1774(+)